MKKRIIALVLTLCLLTGLLCGCTGGSTSTDAAADNRLGFSDPLDKLKALDGQQVTMIGYMATLSPINGEFMYLMNLPYQNCPFCVPNTTQLANTIAVYAPEGEEFEFTDRAIEVSGILEFGEYTDEYGYEYGYRIVDGSFTQVDTSGMGEKLQLWQQLASVDAVAEVYKMYDYVYFLCMWPTYTASFGEGKDYLYPSDALAFISTEGAQFNYGSGESYFSDIVALINSVSTTAFTELTDNVLAAQALAREALEALENEEYTVTAEYSMSFSDNRQQYKLDGQEAFEKKFNEIYHQFSLWLGEWEL